VQLFVLAELEEPQNVRVGKLGQRLALAPEAFDENRIARLLGPQDFEGNVGVQPLIVGTVDRAVPPMAQFFNDFVATDYRRPSRQLYRHGFPESSPLHLLSGNTTQPEADNSLER
jgi:hypothetical protein